MATQAPVFLTSKGTMLQTVILRERMDINYICTCKKLSFL